VVDKVKNQGFILMLCHYLPMVNM